MELWDVKRKRVEFPEGLQIFKSRALYWVPDLELIEDKDSGQQYIQQLRDSKDYKIQIVPMNPEGLDKGTRMSTETPLIEKGGMWIPEEAPWLSDYLTELCLFTGNDSGGHDDQVDMTSQFLKWYRRKYKKRRTYGPAGEEQTSTHSIV